MIMEYLRPGPLAIYTATRVGTQIYGQSFSPMTGNTWMITCYMMEPVLIALSFPPTPTERKVKQGSTLRCVEDLEQENTLRCVEEQDNAICCESGPSNPRSMVHISVILGIVLVWLLAIGVVFYFFHYRHPPSTRLWSRDRRQFYITVTPYFAVPSFMYSMSLFYPYLESGAAWFGLDISNKYFYIVARSAYPVYIALAAWAAWFLTSHMEVPGPATGDERPVDREDGAVKKSVSGV